MRPDEYEEAMGLTLEEPKLTKPSGRGKVKKSLVEGEILSSKVQSEVVPREITKMMKVVGITRTPTGKIGTFEMRVRDGTLYEIEIDEATVAAMAGIFATRGDDDVHT